MPGRCQEGNSDPDNPTPTHFDDESSVGIQAVDDYDVSVCGAPTLEERMAETDARMAESEE